MRWLWGAIMVGVIAAVETTVVPLQLTAMVLAALGIRLGQAGLVWLAVWGGIVLERGLPTIGGLWAIAVAGWGYRRWGGEPRWWVGLVMALVASGVMRWITGNWSILGQVGDMMAWGIVWLIISWWQERWGDEMV